MNIEKRFEKLDNLFSWTIYSRCADQGDKWESLLIKIEIDHTWIITAQNSFASYQIELIATTSKMLILELNYSTSCQISAALIWIDLKCISTNYPFDQWFQIPWSSSPQTPQNQQSQIHLHRPPKETNVDYVQQIILVTFCCFHPQSKNLAYINHSLKLFRIGICSWIETQMINNKTLQDCKTSPTSQCWTPIGRGLNLGLGHSLEVSDSALKYFLLTNSKVAVKIDWSNYQ